MLIYWQSSFFDDLCKNYPLILGFSSVHLEVSKSVNNLS